MNKIFVFSGNRIDVFKRMLELRLSIKHVFAVKNSYLHKYLKDIKYLNYSVITDKAQLIQDLSLIEFDILLANGLPYILPITKLKENNNKRFINIHPSFLPDLKGADPVPGSLLFAKDSGASCHEMDDGIDTGSIISQIRIAFNENIDCSLMYLLCFKAEVNVFNQAMDNNFIIQFEQNEIENPIYYSFKEEDRVVSENDSIIQLTRKVRAFSNKSKGAKIKLSNEEYLVYNVQLIDNSSLVELFPYAKHATILLKYESSILIKWKDSYARIFDFRIIK